MRTKLLKHFGRVAALCLLAPLAAGAQESPATVSPAAPAAPARRLVVQVEYLKGAKPTFQAVPQDVWYGRFGTVATPRPRPAPDTVLAVDVKMRAGEGGRVEIRVGVHVGERHFDRLESVATYHAALGEAVTADELAGVGVAPFVFKVLSVGETAAAAPSVQNITQSIEAVVTEFKPAPLPRGKLTLRNLSTKRVRAVYLRQVVEGRNRLQGFVTEREGKTLMEPGGSAEKSFGAVTGEPSAAGFLPVAVESLAVDAVLFEDYTFEGQPGPAALKRALLEGERAQLPRLLALIREAQAAPAAAAPAAARALREKLLALADAAPQAVVDTVIRSYPGLDQFDPGGTGPGRWKSVVEVAMHDVRRGLLDDLQRFEEEAHSSRPPAGGFKGWLKQRQARYEAWLARL
ncbi:MAG TPA: hypothetical protein VGB98_08030 [Pyrinomonadaceae bacterium]|jgi:hypothetical protein